MAGSPPSTTETERHGPDPPSSSSPPLHPTTGNSVEMTDLDNSERRGVSRDRERTGAGSSSGLLNDVSIPSTSPMDSTFPTMSSSSPLDRQTGENKPTAISTTQETSSPSQSNPTPTAAQAASALNPQSTSSPPVGDGESSPEITATTSKGAPVFLITLLLTSGARHPYKIDEKYLAKRNVNVPGTTDGGRKDPFSISVYTLKELILREWREEWEPQPSSPSAIRLIYFGRLLDDKTDLTDCRFNAEAANVIHMTVRPQDMIDEEEASKGEAMARDRHGDENTAGCLCVIL